MILYIGVDILFFILYLVCLDMLNAAEDGWKNFLNVVSNILLVGISILTTTIITVPLIKLKEDNSLCDRIFAEDILASSDVFNLLSDEKKLSC